MKNRFVSTVFSVKFSCLRSEVLRNQNNPFKMKMIIIFAALFAAVLAAPVEEPKDAIIIRNDSDNIGVGGYSFGFETSDGIVRDEQAVVENAGTENETQKVTGSYSYTAPDGVVYTVTYTADENGFRPFGAHIPSK